MKLGLAILFIFILFSPHTAFAEVDIDAAYKREFIFLKSQIKELKKQKGELTSKMEQAISSAQKDLDHQQKKV
ncbi:MAG: hypothetical protein KDD61_08820, partial [Bdellovibrionales bacterium]|nr:hypothetical protein [Bdellovibrionales bacterium]